ncbi:hypothetical protein [Rudaea sp.]|uniref:hypothetical protein n=1 Tax=Rudaea sp. TaxID=2136325 RepID=UPI003782E138
MNTRTPSRLVPATLPSLICTRGAVVASRAAMLLHGNKIVARIAANAIDAGVRMDADSLLKQTDFMPLSRKRKQE